MRDEENDADVHERAHEHADRDLSDPVLQEPVELTRAEQRRDHRQHEQRDRENQRERAPTDCFRPPVLRGHSRRSWQHLRNHSAGRRKRAVWQWVRGGLQTNSNVEQFMDLLDPSRFFGRSGRQPALAARLLW